MPEYDFSTLSPSDFEVLSRDLLQKEFEVHLESFRKGRDRGIDLRYSKPKSNERWIIQAKHYLKSGFSNLKSVFKNKELQKVSQLNPTRYVVTTSLSLTPKSKDELYNLLQPYCVTSGDIFGQEDLNNLLGKYPEIEKKHFKLWLPNTAVLERLLHNRIYSQGDLEIEDIKRQISLFVPTEALQRANEMLAVSGFCMLTGIPGIGKTTTARILVAQHLEQEQEWECFYLTSQTSDAFEVYSPEKKQIFFYDDFLGLTSLRKRLSKNEDKVLHRLISACRKNPQKKRLILTTREYLYQQALTQNEVLANQTRMDTSKSVVEMKDYTDKIRAQILVNHLYFYGVDSEICNEFIESKTARKTLDHPNYNPRIIETMCKMQESNNLNAKDFCTQFLEMLDSPGKIWDHAYQNQLTKDAQRLLLVFAVHGVSVTLNGLKHHFRIYIEQAGHELFGFDATFAACMKELEDCFLKVNRGSGLHYVTFHNPAIKDFTDAEVIRDPYLLEVALHHFTYEGVLLFAAIRLMENFPAKLNARDCLEAMARADRNTSYSVREHRTGGVLDNPESPVRSLSQWLSTIKKLGDQDSTLECLGKIKDFLLALDPNQVFIPSAVNLYFNYLSVAQKVSCPSTISYETIRDILLPGCDDPDDFTALTRLLPDEEPDDATKILSQHFIKKYEAWLDSEVNCATSSDQIYEAIGAINNTAEELGIDEQDLYFGVAEEIARDLAEKEDANADMHEEDRQMERFDEREDNREVDDILDSLRD